MFVDAYAIISQKNGDGGDSLHREAMYAFGQALRYDSTQQIVYVGEPATSPRPTPQAILSRFEVAPGIYVRHPDPSRWASDPSTTSRDQLVPVIAYCAAYRDYPRLARLFTAVAERALFAQNLFRVGRLNEGPRPLKIPDTMLGTLGLFIRAGGWWTAPLYPVLFLTDSADLIATVLNAIPIHWEEKNRRLRWSEARDVDDNNTIIADLVNSHFKPTPISWLNRQVYALTRPKNLGNSILGETNPVMGALAWYHRKEIGGNPEISELYRPLIEQEFDPKDRYLEAMYYAGQFYVLFKENQDLARRN